MALEELNLRLERLEHKVDQMTSRLRRARPVLAVPQAPARKKPAVKAAVKSVKRVAKKPRLPAPAPVLAVPAALPQAESPVELPVFAPLPPLEAEVPLAMPRFEEVVFLIQPEEATRRVAQEYFGGDTKLIELESAAPLKLESAGRRVLAVIFDRALLGNPEAREIFEALNQDSPQTRLIGLSSYLTLAFAQSMPERSDLATLLTRPLSSEALAALFAPKAEQAIS
ncbi:MAG TPA: hypothetical protein DF383_03165 [Deltaproteobacteria bacterium]|nr:hypothetical protein [Deltaproteobacteria bacterium]